MKPIYLDNDYRCYMTDPNGSLRVVETGVFDCFCNAYIECHRFVPEGETWMREDGVVFHGEMMSPWRGYSEFEEEQRAYEHEKLADAENALAILLGGEST